MIKHSQCVIVHCDGCKEPLTSDGEGVLHWDSVGEGEDYALDYEWARCGDHIFCPECYWSATRDCPECEGDCYVTRSDGTRANCPMCDGDGRFIPGDAATWKRLFKHVREAGR